MLLCGMDRTGFFHLFLKTQWTTAKNKKLQLEINRWTVENKLHLFFPPWDTGKLQSEWLTPVKIPVDLRLQSPPVGLLHWKVGTAGYFPGEGVHIATFNELIPLEGWTLWFRFNTICIEKEGWGSRFIMFWACYMQQIKADYTNDLQ